MAAGLACSAAARSADGADPSSWLSRNAKTRDAIRGIPLATMAAAKRSTKSPTGCCLGLGSTARSLQKNHKIQKLVKYEYACGYVRCDQRARAGEGFRQDSCARRS